MTDHALLLVNLGSPASTEVADVRRYLNQFLMDPYVIDLPWPVRRLLVSRRGCACPEMVNQCPKLSIVLDLDQENPPVQPAIEYAACPP